MKTLLGVLLGFYLAKYQEINKKVAKKVKKIKKPKPYGEPFVVRTDEYALEQEQKKKAEKERIELKEILEK